MRIVAVQPNGDPGGELGTLDLVGGQIVASAGVADQTVAMLRRRSRKEDADLFAWLTENGWSNGQIMIV